MAAPIGGQNSPQTPTATITNVSRTEETGKQLGEQIPVVLQVTAPSPQAIGQNSGIPNDPIVSATFAGTDFSSLLQQITVLPAISIPFFMTVDRTIVC